MMENEYEDVRVDVRVLAAQVVSSSFKPATVIKF